MLLTTDHVFNDCTCTAITRIIDVSYPVEAEVHVRVCAEVARIPLLAAMDALSNAIGRHIITESRAADLVERYSNLSLHDALEGVHRVLTGGYGRRYYVKRDILKACLGNPRKKCVVCGERDCDDRGHAEAADFSNATRYIQEGYVYFMLHAPVKFLKVGYSAQPGKRLQSHRAAIPGELTTLGVVPGGRYMEQAIHEELGEWLVPGHREWFFYSEFVRDYVDRIVGVYKDAPQP